MNLVDITWVVKLKYQCGLLTKDQYTGILDALYLEARAQEVIPAEVSHG